jgi:hypothetical protein
MTRFEELQQKGWPKLTADERTEYQALKNGTPVEQKPGAMMLTTKLEVSGSSEDRIKKLEDMVARLSGELSVSKQETSKLQEGWQDYVPPQARNKTATLKIYRENSDTDPAVIVKVVTFKDNEFNEETRKYDKLVYTVTLMDDKGKTKEIKMDATIFFKIREVERVEIIREDRRMLRKVDGFVYAPDRDKDGFPKRILDGGSGYGRNIGSTSVPLEIFAVKSTVVVKRPGGQEITMDSNYLNL